MAFKYREDQLFFVKDTIEWIYKSSLSQYFVKGKNKFKETMITSMIPICIAYQNVCRYRHFGDRKMSGYLYRR